MKFINIQTVRMPKNTFSFYGKRYKFDTIKFKLTRCPFKHCSGDMLGYLGGDGFAHRCYRHGILMLINPYMFEKGVVTTLELLDNKTWTFQELSERGILKIKLLDKDGNIILQLGYS